MVRTQREASELERGAHGRGRLAGVVVANANEAAADIDTADVGVPSDDGRHVGAGEGVLDRAVPRPPTVDRATSVNGAGEVPTRGDGTVGAGDIGREAPVLAPPLDERAVAVDGRNLGFADGEFLEGNGAVVDALPGERARGGVRGVPAEKGGSVGTQAAEGAAAAGDGTEGDVRQEGEGLSVGDASPGTLDAPGGGSGDDAADDVGAVGDGDGGGGAGCSGGSEEDGQHRGHRHRSSETKPHRSAAARGAGGGLLVGDASSLPHR